MKSNKTRTSEVVKVLKIATGLFVFVTSALSAVVLGLMSVMILTTDLFWSSPFLALGSILCTSVTVYMARLGERLV